MRNSKRLTDAELERLLAAQIRDAYVEEAPDEATEARHLAAIMASARALSDEMPTRSEVSSLGPLNRWRIAMNRNRGVAMAGKLVAVAVAGMALMTGLAVAGVTLPTQAQEAFDRVGLSLPNQASENAHEGGMSDAVRAVIEQRESFASGCEFGQAVAAAASGKSPAADACDKANEQAGTEGDEERGGRGDEAQGDEAGTNDDFGRTTAADAQENARTDGREFGERTRQRALEHAESKSGQSVPKPTPETGGESTGQTQSEEGRSIAESHAPDEGTTGETNSQGGRSIGESKAGEHRP